MVLLQVNLEMLFLQLKKLKVQIDCIGLNLLLIPKKVLFPLQDRINLLKVMRMEQPEVVD